MLGELFPGPLQPGDARLHEPLRSGRGVLLDPDDAFVKVADPWTDRAGGGTAAEPMLIRPDGYVCWAGDPDELEPAPPRWFGCPGSEARRHPREVERARRIRCDADTTRRPLSSVDRPGRHLV
ncbi:hypothetical protein ACIA5G_15165 [Amycolatopsis sp. NPDC051758]|uniref:aromatic-ring hydroxylase C-terminal domain-containing protein n=1 Tax=Amycolatopsis sp. NPDC051758 TaxID=3363935 RepID=UPI0037BD80EA